MVTDVDVQYFSHLNGLVLGNNWGDLIRLLDTCLVNGLPLTSITSASIDDQGDIHLTLYASHNCMLFQIVNLSEFGSVVVDGVSRVINGTYRIKGTQETNKLILKGNISRTTTSLVNLSSIGTAKLASLGYDIVFRDSADVKRVYRAKNPTSAHPFIRVDETISDGTNSYTSTYAKSAMVGLIENMTHIDDYQDPNKLQLPLDTTDFAKNWKITGSGAGVVRGWSRWYWARNTNAFTTSADSQEPVASNRRFTLVGSADAFYFLRQLQSTEGQKILGGCGLYNEALLADVIPNWFLMSTLTQSAADTSLNFVNVEGGSPLTTNANTSAFIAADYTPATKIRNHTVCKPILQDFNTGFSNIFSGNSLGALEIPFTGPSTSLRGSLKSIAYAGNKLSSEVTRPLISDNSMYIWDSVMALSGVGGLYFYLGELG